MIFNNCNTTELIHKICMPAIENYNHQEPLCLIYPKINLHKIILEYYCVYGIFPSVKNIHKACKFIKKNKLKEYYI